MSQSAQHCEKVLSIFLILFFFPILLCRIVLIQHSGGFLIINSLFKVIPKHIGLL